MIITLPWPPSILFPNAAMRDGAKFPRRQAASDYRQDANLEALSVLGGLPVGEIVAIAIDFYPPNNKRDLDGMLSAIKPGIDGIFGYLGQNDSQINQIMLVKHPADKANPRVVISLIQKENENG